MTKLLKFFNKPLFFLDKNVCKINNFLPFFFLSYFVMIFLPYVVADFPLLNAFFMGSTTKLIYRVLTTGYFCLYGLVLAYVNKQGVRWIFIICGLILIVCYTLSVLLAPRYYTYVITDLTHRVEFYEFYIGTYSYFTYGFSFFADVVSFVILISYFPSAMKSIRQVNYTLYFLIIFMLIACLYSIIKEHNSIIQLIKGGSEYNISVRSFFHSKNAFGLYLFVGTFASAFLLMQLETRLRWLFVIPMFAFTIMSLLSMCKSALLCCLILDILIIWFFTFFSKGLSFYISLSLVVLSVFALIGIIMILTIPSMREGKLLAVYNLLSKLFKGIFTRTERWEMVKYIVEGPFIVIGMNESNSTFHLDIISQVMQSLNVEDFHSGYVTWYAHHGVIGCIIYAGLIAYLFYLIILIMKKQRKNGVILLFLLLASLVFMIPESYVMFISISSYTFVINIILICCSMHLSKNNEVKSEECYAS